MDVLCGINKKKKGLERHLFATQFHCLLFVQYNHTFFTTKQNDLSKKKEEQQKLYDVNVRTIYGCRQAGRHWRLMKKKERFGKTFAIQLHCMFIKPHIFYLETD